MNVLQVKDEANKLFQLEKYNEAYELYSNAIELNEHGDSELMAILYGNRAYCDLKMENFGEAMQDANLALEHNPAYLKAYFRRGSANLYLGHFDEAKEDFLRVVTLKPKDRSARLKLKDCKKAIAQLKFAKAIASQHTERNEQVLDLNSINIDDNYKGPHLGEEMTLEFLTEMIEHFRYGNTLHIKYVYQIILRAKQYFSNQPNIININISGEEKVTVCGDVHGQFYDVLNIFELNGFPSPTNPYLFNGDYVDRGSFSCEVILTFLSLKLLYPNSFFMARGNHESRSLHKMYGFEGEVLHKYTNTAYEMFCECFWYLPLAHLINESVFIVHGGLFSQDNVTLDEIQKINRFGEPPMQGIMSDILWADPQPLPGRMASKRGIGYSFGPDITEHFLQTNNLSLVVRSHEVKMDGYQYHHQGKLITIFSAPNYCDSIGNKGAYIVFREDLVPNITTFTHVPHPPIQAMHYASSIYGF